MPRTLVVGAADTLVGALDTPPGPAAAAPVVYAEPVLATSTATIIEIFKK
jgi:hypothetical protein